MWEGRQELSPDHPPQHPSPPLPPPAQIRGHLSLAGLKDIIIYPLPAVVVNVDAEGGDNTYGAFAEIRIKVRFGWANLLGIKFHPDSNDPLERTDDRALPLEGAGMRYTADRTISGAYGVPVQLARVCGPGGCPHGGNPNDKFGGDPHHVDGDIGRLHLDAERHGEGGIWDKPEYPHGVPEVHLELKTEISKVASIWFLPNGSDTLTLDAGHDVDSWAIGVKFIIASYAPGPFEGYDEWKLLNTSARPYYSQTMTTTNISIYDKGGVATLTFAPPWRGGDIMSGKPSTNLTTTGVRTANYVEGNNTDTLIFNYVVHPGDVSAVLEYTNQRALHLTNNYTLRRWTDRPTTWVNTTLLPP